MFPFKAGDIQRHLQIDFFPQSLARFMESDSEFQGVDSLANGEKDELELNRFLRSLIQDFSVIRTSNMGQNPSTNYPVYSEPMIRYNNLLYVSANQMKPNIFTSLMNDHYSNCWSVGTFCNPCHCLQRRLSLFLYFFFALSFLLTRYLWGNVATAWRWRSRPITGPSQIHRIGNGRTGFVFSPSHSHSPDFLHMITARKICSMTMPNLQIAWHFLASCTVLG